MRIIAFILVITSCNIAAGQGFYNNGAIVSIAPGTILSLPDSMVNKGTLINNGQAIISGAWINTGTYDPGVGQVNFDSDITQVINHNKQSIERLVISGGGQKEFLADIFVQTELTLTDGILVSKNGARIVVNQNVTITGGNDNSHVVGPVERRGTGNWLFPVGNGEKYLPVIVPAVTNATSFGILTLHELTASEVLTGTIDLERLSSKRYWEFVTGGDPLDETRITLPVVDEDDLTNDDAVTVATSNAALGPYTDLLKSNFTGSLSQGSITSVGAPSQKYYTVALVLEDRAIEVFNAVSAGNDGKNDFMTIRNIEFYPDNQVVIHNRWGDRVFEISGYDNRERVFKGFSDNGNKLPSGSYFYSINLGDGSKRVTGYVVVR